MLEYSTKSTVHRLVAGFAQSLIDFLKEYDHPYMQLGNAVMKNNLELLEGMSLEQVGNFSS